MSDISCTCGRCEACARWNKPAGFRVEPRTERVGGCDEVIAWEVWSGDELLSIFDDETDAIDYRADRCEYDRRERERLDAIEHAQDRDYWRTERERLDDWSNE